MSPEFKSFPKIGRLEKLRMCITQKMHGSNAQIYITKEGDIYVASRNRWLDIGDDNYGFAAFVEKNREEIIRILGPGRHYGEWCGPGINNEEGLKEKTLFLFNWRRWRSKESHSELPPRVRSIPVLYDGEYVHLGIIEQVLENLKTNGSKAVIDFMKVEGIVIELYGENINPILMKKTFDQEETAWKSAKDRKPFDPTKYVDVSHLLQPLRLEKLLSRDSRYLEKYPASLKQIFSDYVSDLESENQFPKDEEELKEIRRALGKKLFSFVQQHIESINHG